MEKKYLILISCLIATLTACDQSVVDQSPTPTKVSQCRTRNSSLVPVVTTDYVSSGVLQFFELGTDKVRETGVPIHSDALIRMFSDNNCIFVVNALGADNVQLVDTDGNTLAQYSTGRGSNPKDIIVVGDIGYISRFNSNSMVEMKMSTGEIIREHDFQPWADKDGLPEMSRMYRVGNQILIQLNRLDNDGQLEPTEYSSILVFDIDAGRVVKEVRTQLTNPYSMIKAGPDGSLYQASVGSFGNLEDGGIEKFDSKTFESRGVVLSEKVTQKQILDFVILSDSLGLGLVMGYLGGLHTALISFNPQTGQVLETIHTESGYSLVSMAVNKSLTEVWVSDRNSKAPSVLRFDLETWELKSRVTTGLPPFEVRFW